MSTSTLARPSNRPTWATKVELFDPTDGALYERTASLQMHPGEASADEPDPRLLVLFQAMEIAPGDGVSVWLMPRGSYVQSIGLSEDGARALLAELLAVFGGAR